MSCLLFCPHFKFDDVVMSLYNIYSIIVLSVSCVMNTTHIYTYIQPLRAEMSLTVPLYLPFSLPVSSQWPS